MATDKNPNQPGDALNSKNIGKLFLIGGNESKDGDSVILHTLAREAGGEKGRIEIITTASSEPDSLGRVYERALKNIGVGYARSMHIESRSEAEDPDLLDRIAQATAIFFTGGDQLRITSVLGATPVAEAIRRHFFEEGKLVAGTSAGAAAVTGTIITGGESPSALLKGEVKMTGGLALITNTVIDTHFVTRGRFGRLVQVVVSNPRLIGIGLSENTGILITGGTRFRIIGSGLVMIVDGKNIGFMNVPEVQNKEPFSVENITVHVLSSGAGFDLETRVFLPPPNGKPPRTNSGSDGKES